MQGEYEHAATSSYAGSLQALLNFPASFGPWGNNTPLAAAVLAVLTFALLTCTMRLLSLELPVATFLWACTGVWATSCVERLALCTLGRLVPANEEALALLALLRSELGLH